MKFYCTTGFYRFQGFQRYIIFYFWIYRTLDMIFQRLGSNLISKLNSSFYFNQRLPRGALWLLRTGSAGSSFWTIGLNLDWTLQIWEYPFGLVIYFGPLDLDQTNVNRSWRGSPWGLGFRRGSEMCALRSISGEAPVVSRGEEVDDDLREKMAGSGAWSASSFVSWDDDERWLEAGEYDGDLRVTVRRSFGCKMGHARGVRRCAWSDNKVEYRKGATLPSVVVGIVRVCPQIRRALTRNFSVLAAFRTGGWKGEGGGLRGGLIAAVRCRLRQGVSGATGDEQNSIRYCNGVNGNIGDF
jgi:hypothetical protein